METTATTAAIMGITTQLKLKRLDFRILQPKTKEIQQAAVKEVYSCCGLDPCLWYCAFKALVKDGVLVKLEGNLADQHSEGKLCAKGNSGIMLLYDPYRLKRPVKRTNPVKGVNVDPKWVEISWDEAFNLISTKLTEIKSKYGAKSIIGMCHPTFDFIRALGSPNAICHHSTCPFGTMQVYPKIFGGWLEPDLRRSRYILIFGWDCLGTAEQTLARHFAQAKEAGVKIVVFDPRFSTTAAKADEWIPIKPSTDLAVALAIINVIVKENLYDKPFVDSYTYGFDRLVDFIKDYTPEWAAKISDVSAETIRRIAREFATIKPSTIPVRRGPSTVKANSSRLSHAICILQALVGSVDVRGGIVFNRAPNLAWIGPPKTPSLETEVRVDGKDKLPGGGTLIGDCGICHTLSESILREEPYPIKAAIIAKENPVNSYPNQEKIVEALKKLEFIVNVNLYLDETAMFADVVLPCPTYLERDDVVSRDYYSLYPQVACRQPVVTPLYDTKTEGEIWHELGKRMGIEAFLPPIGRAALDAKLEPLGIKFDDLKRIGVWGKEQPFTSIREFGTPTKKVELYSTIFEKYGYDPFPSWKEALAKPTPDYPFYLVVTHPPVHIMSYTQNVAWLHEVYPENYALINTSKAQELGIKDGDEVYIESKWGKIKIKAKLTEGIRPDTICVPHGFGHLSRELPLAYNQGVSDNVLTRPMTISDMLNLKDPVVTACIVDITVKVYKA